MTEAHTSFCRICINHCSLLVETDSNNMVSRVRGNPSDPLYAGYTCVKGRSQGAYLTHSERLLQSLKRLADGKHQPVSSAQAMDEIAEKIQRILQKHGPRAIATYSGTMAMAARSTAQPVFEALFDAIGTSMRFDPNTLDKGGKQVAASLLGSWLAPSQGFDRPEAILLIGINPLVTYTGFPAGGPSTWLTAMLERGCKLIVIDPRQTEVARKATRYLQAKPGHDIPILAAMINVIISERLYDEEFVDRNVTGLDRLERVVASFEPELVSRHADILETDLVGAARDYATARRGYAMAGTGPNMTGRGTVVEYLVLVLETLCGRWLRAGEEVPASPTLLPGYVPRAQAVAPRPHWALPEQMRIRGLTRTAAGLPTAVLPEEILTDGPGQIRALICWGGNPVVAFPDQERTVRALRSLELFVQIDPWYSEAARLADYVIAPTMPLEVPATTMMLDYLAMRGTGYGIGKSYAQYTPAVAARPPGSDLVEEWEFFYGLMKRMDYDVVLRPHGGPLRVGPNEAPEIHVNHDITSDELLELLSARSRVPLTQVKAAKGGALFGDDPLVVLPPEEGGTARLDVGNTEILAELSGLLERILVDDGDVQYPFRLLCRRHNHTYNSSANVPETNRGVPYNPLYMHPADMLSLGATEGSVIRISTKLNSILGIARADPRLRQGAVSMAFGYGGAPDRDGEFRQIGSSPARLIPAENDYDNYTGQPRTTNVAVSLKLHETEGETSTA